MKHNTGIVLVRKRTKWERDYKRYGSADAIRALFSHNQNIYERIFNAHKRQMRNFINIKNSFSRIQFVEIEDLEEIDLQKVKLLVSFGGDNHFIHVSQFVDKQIILGVNSDVQSSTGALLYFDTRKFIASMHKLFEEKETFSRSDFFIEKWTRVEGHIEIPQQKNKIQIQPCISEITIENQNQNHMSRFFVRKEEDERWEELKCSGYLVVNGTGSSGWYANAHPLLIHSKFLREGIFFRALARELYITSKDPIERNLRYWNPEIKANEKLEVLSAMEGQIRVDANSKYSYSFPPGAKAIFYLSSHKLPVVSKIL